MNYRRFTHERVFNLGLILFAWTLYAFFFASQHYVRQVYSGRTPNFQSSLSVWLTCGYSWAVLTYPIFQLARRFPFSREKWLRALAVHIPASLFFSVALLFVFTALRILLGDSYSMERFQDLLAGEIHSGVLVYFGIIGMREAVGYLIRPAAERHHPEISPNPTQQSSNGSHDRSKPDSRSVSVFEPPAPSQFTERFSVKKGNRIVFVTVDQIDSVTSEGNYVKVRSNGESYLLRETMKAMEQKLDPKEFLRVRRSTIVRIDRIKELHPISNGEFEVVMNNGTRLLSSRRYRKNLDVLLKT